MWKNHPSVARSSLKLTLYVICKAKCNHRDHFCCQSQSPSSLSLSVSAAESPPFSPVVSLFCIYLAFALPPLILIFLLPHSIPIAFVTSSFLFLCFLVALLFLQHFYVISLLFLLFFCPVIVSFSLSLPPSLSLTHTKKFPPSEVSEVGKEV